MDEIEKIKKTLISRKMTIYQIEDEFVEVFWEAKGKIKFGRLPKDYTHRYGVSTMITVTDGKKDYWFYDRNYQNVIDYEIQSHMITGTWRNLEPFDVDILNEIKW